jgi:mono/diheme cytochrome c family protein
MKTPASLLALIAAVALARAASAAPDAQKVDFAKDVAPIFKANCVNCHGLDPKKPKKKPAAKLNLESEAGALKGGKSGADVIPGDAKNSLLFKLLSGPVVMPKADEDEDKEIPAMPKAKKGEKWAALKDEDVAIIRQWIDQSAQQAAK